MDRLIFFFDPRCPWCYQTSRWARRLEELGEVELDWRVFALEVVNRPEGTEPGDVEPGSPALRTAVALGEEHGSRAIGPFYAALARSTFEGSSSSDDPIEAVKTALTEAGFDPGLCDRALGDPATWTTVVDWTNRIEARIGKLGVPTIALDDENGPTIFGPVISELPADDEAIELWRHTAWLARNDNFAELKRSRRKPPDLPAVKAMMERRAAAAAAGDGRG